jgi:Glycosyl hydrolases family 18
MGQPLGSNRIRAVSTTPKLVNAWILLGEPDPVVNGQSVGYNDPRSPYQLLIKNDVYRSVDILFLCFATPVPVSSTTIPAGAGGWYTLEIDCMCPPPGSKPHPYGMTNQNYMENVIRDARANNPQIKICMSLDWGGDGKQIANIFSNRSFPPEENAKNFASSLMTYLEHYDLDGFDVDWESSLSDVTTQGQFKLLFTAIGSRFRSAGKKYYLTLSPAEVGNLDAGTVNSFFDFVTLQLYSGFTNPSDFTNAGVNGDLLAYGAKFEADQPSPPDGRGHQTAQAAYQQAQQLGYTTYTAWRLNSQNYEFEQEQQVELYKLVYS